MPDYAGNAKKNKPGEEKPEKNLERVTTGEVIIRKKGVGRKFREIFVQTDFPSLAKYVTYDVAIPAAKNFVWDVLTKGGQRILFGETGRPRNFGSAQEPRYQYQSPIRRQYHDVVSREVTSILRQGYKPAHRSQDDIVLTTRSEAEALLEQLNDIIDTYDKASVADMYEILGVKADFTDNDWGWRYLGNVRIREFRDGFLVDFPPAEPITR
jgi:hypothetical protein